MKFNARHFVDSFDYLCARMAEVLEPLIKEIPEDEVLAMLVARYDYYAVCSFEEHRTEILQRLYTNIVDGYKDDPDYDLSGLIDRVGFYEKILFEEKPVQGFWVKTYTDFPKNGSANCLRAFGDVISCPELIETYYDNPEYKYGLSMKEKDFEYLMFDGVFRHLCGLWPWFEDYVNLLKEGND